MKEKRDEKNAKRNNTKDIDTPIKKQQHEKDPLINSKISEKKQQNQDFKFDDIKIKINNDYQDSQSKKVSFTIKEESAENIFDSKLSKSRSLFQSDLGESGIDKNSNDEELKMVKFYL